MANTIDMIYTFTEDDTIFPTMYAYSHNDFNFFISIFPDLYLSAHCSIRPINYNKDPLFQPPFTVVDDSGIHESYWSNDYRWAITRSTVTINNQNYIQIDIECQMHDEQNEQWISFSNNPASNAEILFTFPSCESLSINNIGDFARVSENTLIFTLSNYNTYGQLLLPCAASLSPSSFINFKLLPKYFIFRQWNELNIKQFYPKKIYGFYKSVDDSGQNAVCKIYNEEVLNTLYNGEDYRDKWALLSEVSNFYLEQDNNNLQSAELQHYTDQTERDVPEYDANSVMLGSKLFRFYNYRDVNNTYAYKGHGFSQAGSSKSLWKIKGTQYGHMNFSPTSEDWNLIGIYFVDNKNKIKLPSLSNTLDETYLIVETGNYSLQFLTNQSYKNLYSMIPDYDHNTKNVYFELMEQWKITENVIFYTGDTPTNAQLIADKYLDKIFKTASAESLKCLDTSATWNSQQQFYWYNETVDTFYKDDYHTILTFLYQYNIFFEGFKGDTYYLTYNTNKFDNASVWHHLFLKSNLDAVGHSFFVTYKNNDKDETYVKLFNDYNSQGDLITTYNSAGYGKIFFRDDRHVPPLNYALFYGGGINHNYNGWSSFLICLNQARQYGFTGSEGLSWSKTVNVTTPNMTFFPQAFGGNSTFHWAKTFSNTSNNQTAYIDYNYLNDYQILWDPTSWQDSDKDDYQHFSFLAAYNNQAYAKKFYVYKIKWNHR